MEKVKIKNSDLYVSRLCFGGCPMGGHGWGDVSRQQLIDAVSKAVDIGINFFDTADIYGLGEGEKLLGYALGERKNEVIIASKFGVRVENGKTFYDNSPEWIKKALNLSLERLDRDYIDIYQLHYRDNITPIEDIINTLEELKRENKIRYYGFSNIHISDIELLNKYKGKFVTFQDEFSLANRKNEVDIKVIIDKLDINVMTWGSLGQGILSGKYDENSKFLNNDRRSRPEYVNFHGKKLLHNLKIVEHMREISKSYNKPLTAIAIRWILDYIPESIVIAGIKNVEQLEMNASALGWTLNTKDIISLEKISSDGGEHND